MAPRLPELKKHLGNTLRHMGFLGFCTGPGVGFELSLPAQDILRFFFFFPLKESDFFFFSRWCCTRICHTRIPRMDSQLNTDVARENCAKDNTLQVSSILTRGLAFISLMQDHFQELWNYLE